MSLLTPSPARTMTETLRAIPRRRRIGLHTPPKAKPYPSAWSYFNTIGAIYLADPAGSEGGAYFNR